MSLAEYIYFARFCKCFLGFFFVDQFWFHFHCLWNLWFSLCLTNSKDSKGSVIKDLFDSSDIKWQVWFLRVDEVNFHTYFLPSVRIFCFWLKSWCHFLMVQVKAFFWSKSFKNNNQGIFHLFDRSSDPEFSIRWSIKTQIKFDVWSILSNFRSFELFCNFFNWCVPCKILIFNFCHLCLLENKSKGCCNYTSDNKSKHCEHKGFLK